MRQGDIESVKSVRVCMCDGEWCLWGICEKYRSLYLDWTGRRLKLRPPTDKSRLNQPVYTGMQTKSEIDLIWSRLKRLIYCFLGQAEPEKIINQSINTSRGKKQKNR